MLDQNNSSESDNGPLAFVGDQSDNTRDPATNNAPSIKINAKKRTKTGCLTCRQRRIKCGEEKPICANCVKSKRECKGYAQRVIFKNPIGIHGVYDSQQLLNAQIQPMPPVIPPAGAYDDRSLPTQISQQRLPGSRHPVLAPKPPGYPALGQSALASPAVNSQLATPGITTPFYYPPVQTQTPASSDHSSMNRSSVSTDRLAHQQQPPEPQSLSNSNDTLRTAEAVAPNLPVQDYSADITRETTHDQLYYSSTTTIPHALASSWNPNSAPFHYGPIQDRQPFYHNELFNTQTPFQVVYDDENDDLYDVDSDNEMADQTQAEGSNQLSLIMTSARQDENRLRSFTAYLNEPNILATYYPTLGSSPLNNPKTARIFIHFIHSTGPCLSIFERHPYNSSLVFGGMVPPAQQGLWTYTLPLKALEHPALLQAILAISSLHISFLQNAPPTVSLKHYHYALKRVGKAVGLPHRRRQIGTLAATLLLGYYEVMAADHTKWNSHVAGSAQLIREIDFSGIARDLRAHRRRIWAQPEYMNQSSFLFANPYNSSNGVSDDDPFAEKESSINQHLIGTISGRAINYDKFGRVEDGPSQPANKHFTRKDIENYRIQSDLYWWYCRQDYIQGMISGNKVLLPFSKWAECPPRAGVGRLDAVYGSSDHTWLLLGRITDFGHRDRKRKLKSWKAAGSDWKPTPALFKFMGRFAGGAPNMGRGPPGPPPGPPPGAHSEGGPVRPAPGATRPDMPRGVSPPMYGMVPPRGPVRLPSAFANNTPRVDEQDEGDDSEDISFNEAEREWEDILAACDALEQAFGRDFQPLPPDVTPPISTPFGPALQYRTQTVAVVWGYYYTARLLLYRLHPCMPPAMMVAAGVAARATAEIAQIIGRISAGIYYPQLFNLNSGNLSPTPGSSLTEMTVPIFFAAVQYTDAAQRGWTVAKLRDVSRLAGFKSSNTIANGCENCWIVAAKQGRGPPYERTSANRPPMYTEVSAEIASAQNNNLERRFVAASGEEQWAMGILSLEDDVLNLEIDDR